MDEKTVIIALIVRIFNLYMKTTFSICFILLWLKKFPQNFKKAIVQNGFSDCDVLKDHYIFYAYIIYLN